MLAACGDIKEFADAGGVDGGTELDAGNPDAPDAPPGTARLTVVKGGAGTGLITSTPAGVDCGATCTLDVPTGTLVTLTATPGVGASFAGWGGACSGSITTCSISVNADTVVNADFAVTTHTVTVINGGNGTGTVTSSVGGINCPGTCTATVPYGTSITLSASTSAPSMFLGWSGDTCTSTGPDGLRPSNSTTCSDHTTALVADGIRAGDAAGVGGAFTTSAVFTPGGGVTAADALCNSEASVASLPGTYRALLATTTASAASRFNTSGAPWGRPDGVLLAPTAAALFQLTLWDSAPSTSASPAHPVAEIFNRYANIDCAATYVKLACLQQ